MFKSASGISSVSRVAALVALLKRASSSPAFSDPSNTSGARAFLNLVGVAACSVAMLEHAVWEGGKGDGSDALELWLEGEDVLLATYEVEKLSREGEGQRKGRSEKEKALLYSKI